MSSVCELKEKVIQKINPSPFTSPRVCDVCFSTSPSAFTKKSCWCKLLIRFSVETTLMSFNTSFHFTDAPEDAWMITFSKSSVLDEHTARASVWPMICLCCLCKYFVTAVCSEDTQEAEESLQVSSVVTVLSDLQWCGRGSLQRHTSKTGESCWFLILT